MTAAVIEANAVRKVFRQGKLDVEVLKGVDFSVAAGESHAILGASGAGKSTLMHLLGGLDHVSSGEIKVLDNSLANLSESRLGRLRNRHLGFIYQFHHLLPEFSAVENIAMPLLMRRESFATAIAEASAWLVKVGLEERAEHKPGELSGGERQRVALARALVTQPDCLLADEPTGNLDQQTAAQMLELMLGLNQEMNTALVVVTHDLSIAARMQHRSRMQDGVLTPEI
ncbi:MAG: ATP-binding cassette domain-containing protein [Gammaproteobacteria bacterium]|nr:ATP-binding cassette domain-containing protein [Gammaproteobacteria bacterium]